MNSNRPPGIRKLAKCSFCLQNIFDKKGNLIVSNNSQSDLTSEDDFIIPEYSLQQIFHYLCMKLKLDEATETEVFQEKHLSVKLCQRCARITTQLTGLCQDLELIQMRVDHLLKELTKVIPTKVRIGPASTRIGNFMRNKTRRLAMAALKRSHQPQVVLQDRKQKITQPQPEIYVPSIPSPVNRQLTIKGQTKISPAIENKNRKLHQCPFCKSTFTKPTRVVLHQALHHAELIFEKERLPEVSTETFKTLCDNLLAEESRLVAELSPCSYCPTVYKDKRALLAHLVKSHYEPLSETLKDRQRNPSGIKDLSCSHCGRLCTSETALVNHTKFYHSELSGDPKCINCGMTFPTIQSLNNHYAERSCGNHNKQSESRQRVECPNCKTSFSSRKNLRKHLKRKVCSQRLNIKNNRNTECPHCSAKLAHQKSLQKHLKRSCKKLKEIHELNSRPTENDDEDTPNMNFETEAVHVKIEADLPDWEEDVDMNVKMESDALEEDLEDDVLMPEGFGDLWGNSWEPDVNSALDAFSAEN